MLFDDDIPEPYDDDGQDDDLFGGSSARPEAAVEIEQDPLTARYAVDLIGHQSIEQELCKMINAGRLPHGLIFSGPRGVGKATLAFRLARALLKRGAEEGAAAGPSLFGDDAGPEPLTSLHVDRQHPVFMQVASGGHPDLLVVERLYDEKKDRTSESLAVDQIREIGPFFRMTAAIEGGWRILIADDAETMTPQSQNALLKILEEPPAKTVLILITQQMGGLLPTIRSRCAMMSFPVLQDKDVEIFLRRVHPHMDADTMKRTLRLAGGSIGQALIYADPGAQDVMARTIELVAAFPALDWTRIQVFAEDNRGGAEMGKLFSQTMLWLAHAMVKAKATGRAVDMGFEHPGLSVLLETFSLAGWIKICDTLEQHFDKVEASHLDKRYQVMGAFMVLKDGGQ